MAGVISVSTLRSCQKWPPATSVRIKKCGKFTTQREFCKRLKYLTDGKYGLQIVDQAVKGVIDCDLSEVERMPLLQIDGREISWEDFGRILMSFEGWQFKLEIVDPSDDV
jgi:hypothetical protein